MAISQELWGKFFQEKKLERNGSRREELEKSLFSKSFGEFFLQKLVEI
jgi:hypothetical protein